MSKSVKIPKTIAGVKLPKQARKTANRAIKMGTNPAVRQFAAAAIGAAGARAAGERKDPDAGIRHVSGSAHIHIDGAKVAEAFKVAAIDGLRRFLEGFEEGLRNATKPVVAENDDEDPEARGFTGTRPGAGRD